MNGRPPLPLEEAREKLRDLGYLTGRVERFVFARALEGRRGVLLPAVAAGAFASALACVAAAASAEPEFGASPAGPAVLLAHLFGAFLLPAVVLAAAAGAAADRSRSPAGAALTAGSLSAAFVFSLWIAGTWKLSRGSASGSLLWGLPVALAALVLSRSVRAGFLARAFARSGMLPRSRRRGLLVLVAAAGLVVGAGVFATRAEPPVPPPLHVSPSTPPLLVVAIDGIAGPGSGSGSGSGSDRPDAPLEAILSRGARGWWAAEGGSPPEIWTTVATGVTPTRHGVRALERVRPAGSPSALLPPFGSAWYLRRLGPALSLVSPAPVSASDRRALAFWEVAASAGLPVAAAGWWASAPWPGADVVDNRQILARADSGEDADRLALARLISRRGDALAAVYLSGPDILRTAPERRDREIAALAAFVQRQAARAAGGEIVLVVLTAASHGPAGATGGIVVFDGAPIGDAPRPGEAPRAVRVRATDVAPSLLARAGIPSARDLDGRPVPALFRPGSCETLTVATYGPRREPAAARPPTSDREYLKKLKALGYLN